MWFLWGDWLGQLQKQKPLICCAGGVCQDLPGQRQKPLLSLYQARYVIPAVAGARYFLCVAKESNQRKATAGLANRGAGQKPKRTICRPGLVVAAPPAPWLSQSQLGINPIPIRLLPSPGGCKYVHQADLFIANIKRAKHTCAKPIVHCKCQAEQTCVCPHSYPPGEGRRRGWPGFWPGLAPTEPRVPRSGVANPG